MLLGALALVGCAQQKAPAAAPAAPTGVPAAAPAKPEQKLIVTPATGLVGKVEKVNVNSRFVVVSFAAGHMPNPGRIMPVYRHGLKVGELRMSSLQLDDNLVADLVAGEAAPGDEVREN
jgi:hypothetical protein